MGLFVLLGCLFVLICLGWLLLDLFFDIGDLKDLFRGLAGLAGCAIIFYALLFILFMIMLYLYS